MKNHHLHQAVYEHGRYTGVPYTYLLFFFYQEMR